MLKGFSNNLIEKTFASEDYEVECYEFGEKLPRKCAVTESDTYRPRCGLITHWT